MAKSKRNRKRSARKRVRFSDPATRYRYRTPTRDEAAAAGTIVRSVVSHDDQDDDRSHSSSSSSNNDDRSNSSFSYNDDGDNAVILMYLSALLRGSSDHNRAIHSSSICPETALFKLLYLCASGDDARDSANSTFIVDNDGVALIFAAAKVMNRDDVSTLPIGMEILTRLMMHCEVARVKIQRLGVAESVLLAMQDHACDGSMQSTGCMFTGTFISGDDSLKNLFAVQLNGIPTILSAMNQHSNNVDVQMGGLQTLGCMCDNKEYAELMIKSDGLTTVATALHKHGDIEKVKTAAKFIINELNDYLQNYGD